MVATYGGKTYGGGTLGGDAAETYAIDISSIARVFQLEQIGVIDPLKITLNDLQPSYNVQLKDNAGTVINITGVSIKASLKNAKTGVLKIDRSVDVTIQDAANGLFRYNWDAVDVDTLGIYYIEFEITPSSGGKFTVPTPSQGRAEVHIINSLDTE